MIIVHYSPCVAFSPFISMPACQIYNRNICNSNIQQQTIPLPLFPVISLLLWKRHNISPNINVYTNYVCCSKEAFQYLLIFCSSCPSYHISPTDSGIQMNANSLIQDTTVLMVTAVPFYSSFAKIISSLLFYHAMK